MWDRLPAPLREPNKGDEKACDLRLDSGEATQSLVQAVDQKVNIRSADTQRRLDTQDIPPDPATSDEQASLFCSFMNHGGRFDGGFLRIPVVHELPAQHPPWATHIADEAM